MRLIHSFYQPSKYNIILNIQFLYLYLFLLFFSVLPKYYDTLEEYNELMENRCKQAIHHLTLNQFYILLHSHTRQFGLSDLDPLIIFLR